MENLGGGLADIVLDPFCGCATTCVAAERWGRRWIGIDQSMLVKDLVSKRMVDEIEGLYIDVAEDINFSTSSPRRSPNDRESGEYVYIVSNPAFPGKYKVGKTGNLKARLSGYHIGTPYRDYKIEYSKQTPVYNELEEKVLDHFPKIKDNGEWVMADLEELKQAIQIFNNELLSDH